MPITHNSVGHARHDGCVIAFAAAIARRRNTHQAGILAVLHIPFQDAILDQDGPVSRRALIVKGEGSTPRIDRAIVDDRDAFRSDLLADAP